LKLTKCDKINSPIKWFGDPPIFIKGEPLLCPEGQECNRGKCVAVQGADPDPVQIPPTDPDPDPDPDPIPDDTICRTCLIEEHNACVPFGFRYNNKYCDTSKSLKSQKKPGLNCNDHFECKSNFCSNGLCVNLVSQLNGISYHLDRIWCKITNINDKNSYNDCVESL
jgi:hypothetical protein